MHTIPFYSVDRDLAAAETRVIHLLVPHEGIPPGDYSLVEFYCPGPDCDCRRVMLNVVEEEEIDRFLASISYGFDRYEEMAGPFLDSLNPQSEYARALLQLVDEIVLSDPGYVARLERHCTLVKQAASDPDHPAYRKLRKILSGDANMTLVPRPARRSRGKPPKRKARPRRKRRGR